MNSSISDSLSSNDVVAATPSPPKKSKIVDSESVTTVNPKTGKPKGVPGRKKSTASSSVTVSRNKTSSAKKQAIAGNNEEDPKSTAKKRPKANPKPKESTKKSKYPKTGAKYIEVEKVDQAIWSSSDEEESVDVGGGQVNLILNRLGSELQQRMKTKKQRLENCFKAVKATPNAILESLNSQTAERNKMIESLKVKTKEVLDQVQGVVELQVSTEEKLSKMMLASHKMFEKMKDTLNTSLNNLNEAVTLFANESGQLEEKLEQNSVKQLQKIEQELSNLQKKILSEGEQEADNLKSTLQLV